MQDPASLSRHVLEFLPLEEFQQAVLSLSKMVPLEAENELRLGCGEPYSAYLCASQEATEILREELLRFSSWCSRDQLPGHLSVHLMS